MQMPILIVIDGTACGAGRKLGQPSCLFPPQRKLFLPDWLICPYSIQRHLTKSEMERVTTPTMKEDRHLSGAVMVCS